MSFDLSTQNITLTQKAKFWTNYISALKGQDALCAAGEGESKLWYPSVWESVPPEARDLKKEIGKIEDQMLSRKNRCVTRWWIMVAGVTVQNTGLRNGCEVLLKLLPVLLGAFGTKFFCGNLKIIEGLKIFFKNKKKKK